MLHGERAKIAATLVPLVNKSEGKEGMDALRRFFPKSLFFWREGYGLIVFWAENRDGPIPRSIEHGAGYIELLLERPSRVKKDRTGENRLLSEEMIPREAAVISVMCA
jgi:hypothetical protein